MSSLLKRTQSNLDSSHSRLSGDTSLDLWRHERLQGVLYKAVKCRDVETTAKILKMSQVDVNTAYEPLGQTLLHLVSIDGCARLCALLCRADAALNLPDDRNFGPIHWACVQGHKSVLRILLNHGADVRLVNEYGDPPLHTAVRHNHVHLLPYLLAPPFQTVSMPLRNGTFKEVEHVNLQNENGDTPLHIATALGRKNMVKKLIRYGADGHLRNAQEMTALDLAAEKRNTSLVQLLKKKFGPSAPPSTLENSSRASSENLPNSNFSNLSSPAMAVNKMPPVALQELDAAEPKNILRRRGSDQKSFELELTGRSLPPGKWKIPSPMASKAVIERSKSPHEKVRNFCYHHHVDDPTKIVELDPLPNNSTREPLPTSVRSDDETWLMKSKKNFRSSSSPHKFGRHPTIPQFQSASLEEKLDEITNKHSATLNHRIVELSKSVHFQLEKMNENLVKQEESIKKSLRKSQEDREKYTSKRSHAGIQTNPDFFPPDPPRPPPPKSIQIPVQLESNMSRHPTKKVAINPDPRFFDESSFDEAWYRDEIIVVKSKKKNNDEQQQRRKRKKSKPLSSESLSSYGSSSLDDGRDVEERSQDLNFEQENMESFKTDSRPNSRLSNYQVGYYNDIFGARRGRVSPRIREIQEQLREAQKRAAMRRYVDLQANPDEDDVHF